MPSPRRFPSFVFRHGDEPDPRFTLANERTFLAWIRTSLAFLAAGIAIETLASTLNPGLRTAASLTLILTGIAAAVHAWCSWALIERAMRRNQPLPSPSISVPLVVLITAAAVLVLLAVVLS